MKLTVAVEDCIIGAVMGLLMVGLSGKFFSLKLPDILYALGFGLFLVFIILDLINEIANFSGSMMIIFLTFAHNIIDAVLTVAFISKFTAYTIPYITDYAVPLLSTPEGIFYAGAFLVVANAIWIFTAPMHA
ncbi:TPA: hypothetical protein HA295_00660 [Candidatus Woesearchaeota archaeon]|nr:hypothetical protein [Candidatus Woesearchaeota archaeon]